MARVHCRAQSLGMLRRSAISMLWFVAAVAVHELFWSLTGSPRPLGLVIGVMAALFAWIDPFRQFHPATGEVGTAVVADRHPPKSGFATR